MSTPDRREPWEKYGLATRAALQAKRELLEELIAECEKLSSEHYYTKTTSISAKAYHKSRSKRWGHWASWLRMKLLALPTEQEPEGGRDAT